MTEERIDTHPADELTPLLAALCNGTLGEAGSARLEALIAESEAARQEYLLYLAVHARLQRRLRGRRPAGEEVELQVAPAEDSVGIWNRLRDTASDYVSLSLLISTIFMAILLLSLGLIVPAPPQSPRNSGPDLDFVAEITETFEAVWAKSSDGNLSSRSLFTGDQLVLRSGLAEVTYATGARVLIQGPATYDILGRNSGHLHAGQLGARVESEQAKGFIVQTPTVVVEDLGTEFLVRVRGDLTTELHVVEGKVNVQNLADPRGTPQALTAGQAVAVGQSISTIPLDEQAVVRDIKRYVALQPRAWHARFSGADEQEGLDLNGEFVHAINFGGEAITIGDAMFASHMSKGGFSVLPVQVNTEFGVRPKLGDTPADQALESVMHSIAWQYSPESIAIDLPVTAGERYKLQLMFSEPLGRKHRHFDIAIDGIVVVDEYDPTSITRELRDTSPPRTMGAAYVSQFVAESDVVRVELNPGQDGPGDPNPYIQALTLEQIGIHAAEFHDNH